MFPPSVPFSFEARKKDVNARDKRGHDVKGCDSIRPHRNGFSTALAMPDS